jgi:hypothetical protein
MEDIIVVVFDSAQGAYEGHSMDARMQESGGVVFRTEKQNFEHKLRVRQITLVRGQI